MKSTVSSVVSQTTVLNYAAGPGVGIYGDGGDGDLTLAGNTVLAAGVRTMRYNNLSIANFTLSADAANFSVTLYVKGTLSLGAGGKVQAFIGNGGTGGGTSHPSVDTAGGNGGKAMAALFVYARTITGTGTIASGSGDGDPGHTPSGIPRAGGPEMTERTASRPT